MGQQRITNERQSPMKDKSRVDDFARLSIDAMTAVGHTPQIAVQIAGRCRMQIATGQDHKFVSDVLRRLQPVQFCMCMVDVARMHGINWQQQI